MCKFFWDLCFCIGTELFKHTNDFFTHLAAVLDQPLIETEFGTSDLIVGSDEEKTFVKAVKCCFPDAKLTLCTRHLEENLKWQLKNKIGMPEKINRLKSLRKFLGQMDWQVWIRQCRSQKKPLKSKENTVKNVEHILLKKWFRQSKLIYSKLQNRIRESRWTGKTIIVRPWTIFWN